MPAISFQSEFLDALLSCEKQQTTRAQTSRIKVGDVCTIYNQQRRRITDKALRRLTLKGCFMVHDRGERDYPEYGAYYHSHFLGKVEITEVYDIHPHLMSDRPLEEWAMADGFLDFASASCWFEIRYGARWMYQLWTVIRWDGWLERYFEPYEVIR
jgi:hypothetical protein